MQASSGDEDWMFRDYGALATANKLASVGAK